MKKEKALQIIENKIYNGAKLNDLLRLPLVDRFNIEEEELIKIFDKLETSPKPITNRFQYKTYEPDKEDISVKPKCRKISITLPTNILNKARASCNRYSFSYLIRNLLQNYLDERDKDKREAEAKDETLD